jgi:hypothetical protein
MPLHLHFAPLTLTFNATEPSLPTHASVSSLGLKHGDMLHLRLDESKVSTMTCCLHIVAPCVNFHILKAALMLLHFSEQVGMAHEEALGPKKINADGTIVQQSYEEVSKKTGFRPGRLSLRSIKMKWTLADFMAMDDEFTFKMKRQVQNYNCSLLVYKLFERTSLTARTMLTWCVSI